MTVERPSTAAVFPSTKAVRNAVAITRAATTSRPARRELGLVAGRRQPALVEAERGQVATELPEQIGQRLLGLALFSFTLLGLDRCLSRLVRHDALPIAVRAAARRV